MTKNFKQKNLVKGHSSDSEGLLRKEGLSGQVLNEKAIISMINLVKYPVITEKTYISIYKNHQYTFDVDKRLTKQQIKKLFLTLFKVNVIAVNTHIPPRKKISIGMAKGDKPTYKRAIITLEKGSSINYTLNYSNNVSN